MPTGAITGYIDVAQVVLYAFWIFFGGLIFYLRREDKREGYPLESDRSGRVMVQGFPAMPGPKTFLMSDGSTRTVPSTKADRRDAPVVPLLPWPGAPMEPTGNPMKDGVGPASYANRDDVPEHAIDGAPSIMPLRALSDFAIGPIDADPRGMTVIGADGRSAGTVKDVWIDRAETIIRYLEVDVARYRSAYRAGSDNHGAHLGPKSHGEGTFNIGFAVCRRARDCKSQSNHQTGGRSDCRLYRRRHALRDSCADGARAMSIFAPELPFRVRCLPVKQCSGGAGRNGAGLRCVHSACARSRSISACLRSGALPRTYPPVTALCRRMTSRVAYRSVRWRAECCSLLAWLSSRTTQYTITSRRIIMQFGVALPMTLNIPFRILGAAALRSYADGSGDIPIAISGGDQVAYLMLWPHVRPWRTVRTEPMLRSIEDAKHVSEILARAVVTAANASGSLKILVGGKANAVGAAVPAQAVASWLKGAATMAKSTADRRFPPGVLYGAGVLDWSSVC